MAAASAAAPAAASAAAWAVAASTAAWAAAAPAAWRGRRRLRLHRRQPGHESDDAVAGAANDGRRLWRHGRRLWRRRLWRGGMGGGGFGDKTTTTTPGRTSVCVPGLLCSSSVADTQRRGLRPKWVGASSQRPPHWLNPRSVGTRSEINLRWIDRWIDGPAARDGRTRTISERGFIRSDRSPEDRRPIGDLTSKPFFFFFCANWAPSARETSWPSAVAQVVPARATAMTRFIFFPSTSRRAILGTPPACARSNAFPGPPSRLSLSRHATCHGGRRSTDFGIAGSAGCAPLRNNGGLT